MMTREQMIKAVDVLTPAQRRIVMEAAQVIRTAREAGDDRPAVQLATPILGLRPVEYF